jgi:hypothetical protein
MFEWAVSLPKSWWYNDFVEAPEFSFAKIAMVHYNSTYLTTNPNMHNPKIHQETTLIMKRIYDNHSKNNWFWTFTIEINTTGWHDYSKNILIQTILNFP